MKSKKFQMKTTVFNKNILALSVACMPYLAFSQHVTPDAGALQHDIEQGLNKPAAPELNQPLGPPVAPAAQPGELTVTPVQFQFVGNTLLSNEQLTVALEGYLNTPLTFAQLKQAADVVAVAYRNAGWFVRAYLPKQQITDGVVVIQIVEARLGGVQIPQVNDSRVPASRLRATVLANQAVGEPINASNIDRVLLLLDDLPGVGVTGAFVEGANEGETDLALTVVDKALLNGNIAADNTGARSTGAARASANLGVNSPLGLGDLLLNNFVVSQGSDYVRSAYSLPVGYDGWRAGVHASYLHYDLVGAFAALGATGTASTVGLEASYPVVRSVSENVNFSVAADQKRYLNQALSSAGATGPAATVSDYPIRALNFALNGASFDNWASGGGNAWGLNVVHGIVNLNGSPNQANDAQAANTQGDYSKLMLNVSRQQNLTSNLSLYAVATTQFASHNLDSSEKMYLGGPYGVRAYPVNEAGGSLGQTFTAELRAKLPEGWSWTTFYDYGHVQVNRFNAALNGSALSQINDVSLAGLGTSLGWQSVDGIDLKATLAHRNGSNPLANAQTGMDTDGSKALNRLWLTASWAL